MSLRYIEAPDILNLVTKWKYFVFSIEDRELSG
jgi:hypothetical protein